jgi:imidazolonepropionase
MTAEQALQAATLGGATALRRPDLGRITTGARADLVVLDAPSPIYLAYRPGVDLVRSVVKEGAVVR